MNEAYLSRPPTRWIAATAAVLAGLAALWAWVRTEPHPLAILLVLAAVPAALGLVAILVSGSPMLRRYVMTRILLTVPMVLILATVVFLVLRVVPGDPVTSTLGPKGNPEMRADLQAQLGLDDPLIVQYGNFLGDIVTFDLGNALTSGRRPIVDELGERLPATVELVVPAAALALTTGVVFGTFAASRRRRAPDYGLRLASVALYSMPIFWLGLLFQLLFSVTLGWTPVAGRIDARTGTSLDRVTNMLVVDSLISGNWAALGSALHHLILPVATLGLVLSGAFLRLTRINVIETLQQDYIMAARTRGLRERVVVYRHALKNAVIPVITLMGLQVAILLAGAILTESVFSLPGMGRYLVERITLRDYTAVQSVITVFAVLVAMISLAVDIVYSLVDPRVRY